MGRIKINIQGKKIFQLNLPVRITDLNYGRHVGNDSMISILHEARMQWLQSIQCSEMDFHGVSLIMAGLMVEYKNESFYGDNLAISLFSGEWSSAGFELFYEATCNRNEQTIWICKAKTDMVCFNYDTRKIAALPKAAIECLQ